MRNRGILGYVHDGMAGFVAELEAELAILPQAAPAPWRSTTRGTDATISRGAGIRRLAVSKPD